MWTRLELKTKAKRFLKQNYITAFFVSLILMFVTSSGSSNNNSKYSVSSDQVFQGGNFDPSGLWAWVPAISLIFIVIMIVVILLKVFIGYVLEVGGRNYYLRGTEREVTFREVGFGFNSDYYFNIVLTMFIKGIYNLLWFLLLIIPGIVKMYAYSMVPYILADNPNIDSGRAIELSMDMTNGQKWDMFVLDLSFLGWYILGLLLFGIGTWFVNPYVDATKAQLYASLRLDAIKRNLCSPEELCYTLSDDLYSDSNADDWYDEY